MATREQIVTALLALLQGCGDFVTVSRRNRSPDTVGPVQSPALFLLEEKEDYIRKSEALPPVRRLRVSAVFYNDVGQNFNVAPSTAINNALDQLDALLAPDNLSYGTFTLGGLVKSLMISGEVEKAPGDRTGKSIAVVPIVIEIP